MSAIAIGVDIGGTSTRAVATRGDGTTSSIARAPGANPTTNGPEAVDVSIGEAVGAAVREVGGSSSWPDASVVVGVAGLAPEHQPAFAARVAEVVRTSCGWDREPSVDTRPDTEIAFAAGTDLTSGVVVIAGTGAVAARLQAGRQQSSVDGHGWRLGDAGSGYWIGARLLRCCLEALDGRARRGELLDAVTTALGIAPGPADATRWALVRFGTSAHPSDVAALARLVSTCPDLLVASVSADAVRELARSVRALAPVPGEVAVLSGGVLASDGPIGSALATHLEDVGLVVRFATEPVHGALRLAQERR